MGTHTPTPWEAALDMDGRHKGFSIMASWECNGSEPYHPLIARTLHGNGNAPMEIARANAAHIVKCVNGWDEQQAKIDELVGLLTNAQDMIGKLRAECMTARRAAETIIGGGFAPMFPLDRERYVLQTAIDAALTRAKSGE